MKSIISEAVRKGRSNEVVWRYGFNFLPSLNYRLGSAARPTGEAGSVLDDLDRNGIAVTTVEDLLGEKAVFDELCEETDSILASRSAEIEALRKEAADENAIGKKTFNIELLGSSLEFRPDRVFERFALQDRILDVANAYLGMVAKLRYYNVWNTFATRSKARESQLWHFDREDNYILKLFVYLRDVDAGNGPFTYAPGTHRKGDRRGAAPEYFLEENVRRSTDDQMAAVIPREEWKPGTGRKGTVIFADTRGYHKGGEARTGDRLMFTCMFTSRASDSKRLISYPNELDLSDYSARKRAALELE